MSDEDEAPFIMGEGLKTWLLKVAVAHAGVILVTGKDNIYAMSNYQFQFDDHPDGFTVKVIDLEEPGAGHA